MNVRTRFGKLRRALRVPVTVGRLGADLLRGPVARHRAQARLRARWLRLAWSWKRVRLRRRTPHRSIVVVALIEHLGDIVAAEPVARYLRREYPDACLFWVVKESYRELLEHNPHVHGILSVGCLTEWIHLAPSPAFDRVIDLQLQGRECATCRVPLEKPGGDRGVTFHTYYALGNLLQAFSRAAGLPALDGAPQVYIPHTARTRVDALQLPPAYAVIHCTSSQDERDWTADRWRTLTDAIAASTDLRVVEVGMRPVVGGTRSGYTDLCGRLSILETAEVIRRAQVFIGVDSGPAHLANAVGTYGIVLLGTYGPFERYLPYSGGYADGTNASILYAEDGPAATIPAARVIEAVHERLSSGRRRLA